MIKIFREVDGDGEFFTFANDPLLRSFDTLKATQTAAGEDLEWWEEGPGCWLADDGIEEEE